MKRKCISPHVLLALQALRRLPVVVLMEDMTSIAIRNLGDHVKTGLRKHAAGNGRSMQEEVRLILREAVGQEAVPWSYPAYAELCIVGATSTYLVDVLQRIAEHPAKRVIELTPRVWKTMFADHPLRSDLARTRAPPPQ